MHWPSWPIMPLQVAAHQQIELLVCSAHFHICFRGHGIIALAKGDKEIHEWRLAASVPGSVFKIVAFQHPRNRGAGRKPDKNPEAFICPSHFELNSIMVFRGPGILKTCFCKVSAFLSTCSPVSGGDGFVSAGRIANCACKSPIRKTTVWPDVRKWRILCDNGMAQMQIGRCGDQNRLSRAAVCPLAIFCGEFAFIDNFCRAAPDLRHLTVDIRHHFFLYAEIFCPQNIIFYLHFTNPYSNTRAGDGIAGSSAKRKEGFK